MTSFARPRGPVHARRAALLLGLASALTGLVVSGAPAPPDAEAGSPGWKNHCSYSHSRSDDPITAPRRPGAAHLHDFFGNRSTAARSTYSSMLAASSRCEVARDTAALWAPALYRYGRKVRPGKVSVYYRKYGTENLHVRTMPPDLRMIAGRGHARSLAENPLLGTSKLYWNCESGDRKRATPPSCPDGTLVLHVRFPNCWNGHRTHVDDSANLRYGDGRCPTGFPYAIPMVILRIEYPVGASSRGLSLASGTVYSVHADFWNTWHQASLDRLVRRCLNGDRDCGSDPKP